MRVTVTPDQIRTAFEAVKDDASFDESRGLWERGSPPVEMIQAMCLRPEILRAFAGFGQCVYPGGLLERRVKELVIITASTTNDCQFCTASHCDLVAIAGIIDDPLEAIDRPASLAPRERIAIEYTRAAMTDSNAIPGPLQDRLHEHFSVRRARRAHLPHRLHQHAQPVQQLPRRALSRRLPGPEDRCWRVKRAGFAAVSAGVVAVPARGVSASLRETKPGHPVHGIARQSATGRLEGYG